METKYFDVEEFFNHYRNDVRSECLKQKRKNWKLVKKKNIIQDLKKKDDVNCRKQYPSDRYVYRKYMDSEDYPIPMPNKNTFYDISKITEEQLIELLII